MYPDNYMNPMNNPMTNPNYGYNRMQQVQQMQRAINPQVPNMFGQVEQPQQMQSFISAVPVTCLEEAKAARIALDGSMSVFVNIQDGEIYTKQLLAQSLPSGANTLPVQIQIGTTVYPVYTRTGNLLRADQIRCRRVYPIIFGSDPNHFSMLCCVPNTVYTPTAPTVPTVEVLED